jgi:hypothetical protein
MRPGKIFDGGLGLLVFATLVAAATTGLRSCGGPGDNLSRVPETDAGERMPWSLLDLKAKGRGPVALLPPFPSPGSRFVIEFHLDDKALAAWCPAPRLEMTMPNGKVSSWSARTLDRPIPTSLDARKSLDDVRLLILGEVPSEPSLAGRRVRGVFDCQYRKAEPTTALRYQGFDADAHQAFELFVATPEVQASYGRWMRLFWWIFLGAPIVALGALGATRRFWISNPAREAAGLLIVLVVAASWLALNWFPLGGYLSTIVFGGGCLAALAVAAYERLGK